MAAETMAESAAYAKAKVGGKPVRPVTANTKDKLCLRWKLASGPVCTRDREHPGQCVAEGRTKIVQVWSR